MHKQQRSKIKRKHIKAVKNFSFYSNKKNLLRESWKSDLKSNFNLNKDRKNWLKKHKNKNKMLFNNKNWKLKLNGKEGDQKQWKDFKKAKIKENHIYEFIADPILLSKLNQLKVWDKINFLLKLVSAHRRKTHLCRKACLKSTFTNSLKRNQSKKKDSVKNMRNLF